MIYKEPNHPGQILLPPLHIKVSLSALWSDTANPASLLSISTCCTTSTHSWKRKAPVFHSTSLGLPPPPRTPFGGDNPVIIPSSPCLQTPLPHPTLLRCPPSSPITPPLWLSHYELYYFDPGPSICFNWIMICNHVLSGESIKRAGASAPLLRGLLLFPHPPPPHTHTFDPSASPFSFQAPTKYPRTWAAAAAGGGPCKGRGGLMAPLLIFHGPRSPMERGLRGTRWSPAGGSGDTGGGEGRPKTGGPPPLALKLTLH